MVDVTTLEETAVRLPANDTASDTVLEPRNKNLRNEAPRRERLLALREAIERGEYRVSASELANAILRACRRAN